MAVMFFSLMSSEGFIYLEQSFLAAMLAKQGSPLDLENWLGSTSGKCYFKGRWPLKVSNRKILSQVSQSVEGSIIH